MKLLGKIGLSIAVLFILVMFSACGTVEYSVKDFADVTVIGYTEHGTLSIKVNDAAVNKIYADGKGIKQPPSDLQKHSGFLMTVKAMRILIFPTAMLLQ